MTIILLDPMMSAAVILGISGAALVAAKSSQVRRAGFSCWIFGNLIWVLEGVFTENIYLVVMFGFYWVTAVFGFYNSMNCINIYETKTRKYITALNLYRLLKNYL